MLTVIHQYRSDVDKGQLLIKTLIKEHLCLNSRNAMKINTKPLLTCDEHVVKMFLQKASEIWSKTYVKHIESQTFKVWNPLGKT